MGGVGRKLSLDGQDGVLTPSQAHQGQGPEVLEPGDARRHELQGLVKAGQGPLKVLPGQEIHPLPGQGQPLGLPGPLDQAFRAQFPAGVGGVAQQG